MGRRQDAHAKRPALASAGVEGGVEAEGPLAADGPWRLRSPPPFVAKACKCRRLMKAVPAALPKTAVAVASVDGATVTALKHAGGGGAAAWRIFAAHRRHCRGGAGGNGRADGATPLLPLSAARGKRRERVDPRG